MVIPIKMAPTLREIAEILSLIKYKIKRERKPKNRRKKTIIGVKTFLK
jgi:hypothetical protein